LIALFDFYVKDLQLVASLSMFVPAQSGDQPGSLEVTGSIEERARRSSGRENSTKENMKDSATE